MEDGLGVYLLDAPPIVTFAGVADIAFGTVLSKFNRSIKYTITADIVTNTILSFLNRLRKFISSIDIAVATALTKFNRSIKITGYTDIAITAGASLTVSGGTSAPNTRRWKRTGYHRSLQ